MSILGQHYLRLLLAARTEEEFEELAITILSRLDHRLRINELTETQVNSLIDEIVRGLFEAGYEKRGQLGLEEYAGLEDLHESLSLDNSKSDDLMAMALPRTKTSTKTWKR